MRVLHLTGSAVSGFFADLSRLYAVDCLEATSRRPCGTSNNWGST